MKPELESSVSFFGRAALAIPYAIAAGFEYRNEFMPMRRFSDQEINLFVMNQAYSDIYGEEWWDVNPVG